MIIATCSCCWGGGIHSCVPGHESDLPHWAWSWCWLPQICMEMGLRWLQDTPQNHDSFIILKKHWNSMICSRCSVTLHLNPCPCKYTVGCGQSLHRRTDWILYRSRATVSPREGHTEALWMALDAMHRTTYLLSLKFAGTQRSGFPKAFRSINLILERN